MSRRYFPSHPAQRRHGKMFRNMSRGPRERLRLLQGMITALVRHERVETSYAKGHEAQKYAERLIDVAKNGFKDPEAMQVANTWLGEKDLVHKLFKVLVPRYENFGGSYTKLWCVGERGMHLHPSASTMAFLEFVGNPFPPLQPEKQKNPDWLVNILLQGTQNEVNPDEITDLLQNVSLGTKYDFDGNLSQDVRETKTNLSTKKANSHQPSEEGTAV
ncbi:large ribosomal subunit protein bL17m-like [Ptychodera flava]|uniref:large ribosomal subunit protein bL17m-like n=1 Tax=Ptychodera flava TaxID=63121 RepID=UPI00396A8A6E